MGFANIFKKFDLFGVDMRWNYHGNHKAQSKIGGFVTLIFMGLCLWVVIEGIQSLAVKKNPTTNFSEFFNPDPDAQKISKDTFLFAFGMQDGVEFKHFIDESYYTVSASLRISTRTVEESGEITVTFDREDLELEVCSRENFGENIEKFNTLEIPHLYCLKDEQPVKVEIEGTFESAVYKKLLIEVHRCDPATSEVTCKSDAEIDEKIEGGYISIYYTDKSIDPENYNQPDVAFRSSKFWMTSKSIRKEVYFYTKPIHLLTDDSIVEEEFNEKKYVTFDRAQETMAMNKPELFFGLHMVASPNGIYYYRRYAKFAEILAEVNGLATMFLVVMTFCIEPIQKYQFYRDFVSKRYKLCDTELRNYKKTLSNKDFQKSLSLVNIDEKKFKHVLDDLRISVFQTGQNLLEEKESTIKQTLLEHKKKFQDQVRARLEDIEPDIQPIDDNPDQNGSQEKDQLNESQSEENQSNGKDVNPKIGSFGELEVAAEVEQPQEKTTKNKLSSLLTIQRLNPSLKKKQINPDAKPGEIANVEEQKDDNDTRRQSKPHPQEHPQEHLIPIYEEEVKVEQEGSGSSNTKPGRGNNDLGEANTRVPFVRSRGGTIIKFDKAHTQFLQTKKQNGSALNLPLRKYISSYMPWASEKQKTMRMLFDMGHERIEDILDVDKLFQLRREVDLLKKIFIKNDMEKYFDMIAADKIEIKREEFIEKLISVQKEKSPTKQNSEPKTFGQ